MVNVEQIRQAIIEAIPSDSAHKGQPPTPGTVYVPPAHVKALRLESSLVIGARGVGKSFWTAALGSAELRSKVLKDPVRELERTEVRIGFAEQSNLEAYPRPGLIAELLAQGFRAGEIWWAVVARWAAEVVGAAIPTDTWLATTSWIKSHQEPLGKLLEQANQHFQSRGQHGLIVFDALDLTSPDWPTIDIIVRELLQVVLGFRAYPALHAKVFLREDQFSRNVKDFPDASKLLATKAELTWQLHDLHGLLWSLLCNAPEPYGQTMREVCSQVMAQPLQQRELAWWLNDAARREGPMQRALFAALAGEWMGTDKRRGVPYVWSVSHLADGRGQTSPRSFQVAIRAATEDTQNRYPDYGYALHYESIKRGVQQASLVRIDHIAEDYPWITKLFQGPLQGMKVPCDFAQIDERWRQHFPNGVGTFAHDRLPPQDVTQGWLGVRDDLIGIGVFQTMRDGRINMPDLYRVGFGLGRHGGVPPIIK